MVLTVCVHDTNGIKCGLGSYNLSTSLLNPVAARSKAWVWGRSLTGIMGSIHPGGMDVCLLCSLCVVK